MVFARLQVMDIVEFLIARRTRPVPTYSYFSRSREFSRLARSSHASYYVDHVYLFLLPGFVLLTVIHQLERLT
jgi:hypothetical protein